MTMFLSRFVLLSTMSLLTYLTSGTAAIAAPANGCDRGASEFDCYSANDGSITISVRREAAGTAQSDLPRVPDAVDKVAEANFSEIGAAFCGSSVEAARGNGTPPEIEALCGFAPVAERVVPPPTPEQVLGAFRELGLFRGVVWSDPGRVSFVNFETYFWCGDAARSCAAIGEGERTVALLGQAVRIRPRIVGYEWRFGDGSGLRTSAARVAHTYSHTGAMAVSVTLTWTADYAVGGGGFQPVEGTTTTTSPVRVLPVEETQAVAR